jgi:hypothetical protein
VLEDQERATGGETTRPRVEERRYVMAFDFTVRVTDLRWQDDGKGTDEVREHRRERVERQGRLLHALLQDPGALHEFMIYLVTDRVCGHQDSELARVFGVKEEEEMLEQVFSQLGEGDARFFREAVRDGLFMDNTWEFERSFAVDWTWASLFQIGWETEGDTAEADGRWGPEVRRLEELLRERRRRKPPGESDNLR